LLLEALEPRTLLALDPSPIEQELLLYVNRMRTDPQGEYDRLIETTSPLQARDAEVNSDLQFFNVDGNLLRSQWNSLTPVAPLAWNESLYNAALTHNAAMIAARTQAHQLPGEPDPGQRMINAGYNWNEYGENIFAYAATPLEAHAAFAIDWGSGPGGIQSPPGHRNNIMAAVHREAGIAIDLFSQSGVFFGPLVVTQDFASRANIGNAFVVGAVWDDANHSGWYEAGEGLGGATIEFTKAGNQPVRVQSLSAGGYQVQLPPGTWNARATGVFGEIQVGSVVVGASNVMVNFVAPGAIAPVAADDRAATVRNQPVTVNVRANDSDPDGSLAAATIETVSSPAGSNVSLDQVAGTITFTPPANFSGASEVRYRLRDQQGLASSEAKVAIAVADASRPRQNPVDALDVDFDGTIAPLDALIVINALNAFGPHPLDPYAPGQELIPFWDSSGDNYLTSLDALMVFNYLNTGIARASAPSASASSVAGSAVGISPEAVVWWLQDDGQVQNSTRSYLRRNSHM
jgi:uncharacterized protein YkwD